MIATWPDTYTYEGIAFSVCATQTADSSPVYRFFNTRRGFHFYTASAEERDIVIARWPTTYRYEGIAFWVRQ